MQVLLLGLFVALYLHDATTAVAVAGDDGVSRYVEALPADAWPYLGPLSVAAIVLLPKLLIVLGYHAACVRTRLALGQQRGQSALRRLEAFTSVLPSLLLGLFLIDLSAGALRVVRLVVRHTVLVDELVVLLPTLVTIIAAWWAYYPVDRRLREAVIFRRADQGKPVYPLLSRRQYLAMHLRHQVALLLLPLIAIFGWSEALALLGPDHRGLLGADTAMLLTPVGVLIVFVLSPLIVRYLWQTDPLPDGEVRTRMTGLCKLHDVRVRELLLWRSGGMVNAAVTGMVRQVRYILLSDGLLEQVKPRAVEAVMAHELAHVKQRHIIWMGLVLIVSLGIGELAVHIAMDTFIGQAQAEATSDPGDQAGGVGFDLSDVQNRLLIAAVPAFAMTLLVFGFVSRRIERQADVFATRHLAMTAEPKKADALGRTVFDQDSIETMVHALQQVSDLNHAPVDRPSWRHGSIAWRQDHLRSLEGRPTDQAPIDQVMTRVKIATLAGLALLIVMVAL